MPDHTPRRPVVAVTLVAMAILLAACGGGDAGGESARDADAPRRGGSLDIALSAETSDGYCLPEAQLSAAGITVATSIYDTLTEPDGKGGYRPSLAESVEPNDDNTVWTITLRRGVMFHDGSPLTAEVVKNNLDAYRGKYPARKPLLFTFVLANIAAVEATDELTVTVTTKTPWVAFPSYLYSVGRLGIMAQSQLDDTEACDRELVGTGPFSFVEWEVGDHLTVKRNPDYWSEAPDGRPFPYLDELVFRPIDEEEQRINALESGRVDLITSDTGQGLTTLEELDEDDVVAVHRVNPPTTVDYVMFNVEEAPFDDLSVRRAITLAIDRGQINEVAHNGQFEVAATPFAETRLGYLDDSGFPAHDPVEARRTIAAYERRTGTPVQFTLTTSTDPRAVSIAQLVQGMLREAGMEVQIQPVEGAALISRLISGSFEATMWGNSHPNGDPDEQYVWWYSGSPVNFGNVSDPEIDRLLDAGRGEDDPDARARAYEAITRRFAEQLWNVWLFLPVPSIAVRPSVGGVEWAESAGGGTADKGTSPSVPSQIPIVERLWLVE